MRKRHFDEKDPELRREDACPLRMADPRQGSRLRVNLKEKDRWLAN
jgi:hypothetical protein